MSRPSGMRPEDLSPDFSRRDNTGLIAGERGLPVRQDIDGTQIQRLGIAGAEADWGPDSQVITDTDEIVARPEKVGGTAEMAGIIRSLNDEPFSTVIGWVQEDCTIESVSDLESSEDGGGCIVERPAGGQSVDEHIIQSITTKGDHARVFVEDESADGVENEVVYTINFH